MYKVKYQGGYPAWATPQNAEISIKGDKLMIKESGFTSMQRTILIQKDDIIEISFKKRATRSAGKTVGGAIVGGILTGGIGLLVGGAIGARQKNKSELYITYKYNNRELVLSIEAGRDVNNIYSMINSLFVVIEPPKPILKNINIREYSSAEPTLEEIKDSAKLSEVNKNGDNTGCAIAIIVISIALFIFLMVQCG